MKKILGQTSKLENETEEAPVLVHNNDDKQDEDEEEEDLDDDEEKMLVGHELTDANELSDNLETTTTTADTTTTLINDSDTQNISFHERER